MDITKMTAAQRAELKAQLEAEERAEKQKREESKMCIRDSPRTARLADTTASGPVAPGTGAAAGSIRPRYDLRERDFG